MTSAVRIVTRANTPFLIAASMLIILICGLRTRSRTIILRNTARIPLASQDTLYDSHCRGPVRVAQIRPLLPPTPAHQPLHNASHILGSHGRRHVTDTLYIRLDTAQHRSRHPHAQPVSVRVSTTTRFHASHAHVRVTVRMRNDAGHYNAHVQFYPQGHGLSHQICVLPYKLETTLPVSATELAVHEPVHVQTLNIVSSIVMRILRPPQRRVPAQTYIVFDHASRLRHLSAHELHVYLLHVPLPKGHAALRVYCIYPRRNPRQMLHRRLKLLALPRPLHSRRPHIAPHRAQLTDKRPRTVLVRQHLPQSTLGQDATALQAQSSTTNHVSIDAKSLTSRFGQQQHVHHGPENTLAPRTADKLPRLVPQQMLHPLLCSHLDWPLLVQIPNSHRKLQGESLDKLAPAVRACWLVTLAGPPIHQIFPQPPGLLLIVNCIHLLTHGPRISVLRGRLPSRGNCDLETKLTFHSIHRRAHRFASHQHLTPGVPVHPPHEITHMNLSRPGRRLALGAICSRRAIDTAALVLGPHIALHSREQIHDRLIVPVLEAAHLALRLRLEAHPPTLQPFPDLKLAVVQPQAKRLRVHRILLVCDTLLRLQLRRRALVPRTTIFTARAARLIILAAITLSRFLGASLPLLLLGGRSEKCHIESSRHELLGG